MTPEDFTSASPGQLVAVTSARGQDAWAFLPEPLPPPLNIDVELASVSERAAHSLGSLNGLGSMLPNPLLLIRPFVRREALASSRIEGTRAEFDQLVLSEANPVRQADPDIQEVANYIDALYTGWRRHENRPLATGILLELHAQLMTGVRGQDKHPGKLRTRPVMIGASGDDLISARFVPPPTEVRMLLDDLMRYLNEDQVLPALVRLALIHYQFETIHPFNDGNGRMGRLLMPLTLHSWGLLDSPLLYLSEYFERHRDEYIDRLYRVSKGGEWRAWVMFVLQAIDFQASDAMARARRLLLMRDEMRAAYQTQRGGRILPIIDRLFERPTITINEAAAMLGVTYPTASAAIKALEADRILVEQTGQGRNRVYLAPGILREIVGEDR